MRNFARRLFQRANRLYAVRSNVTVETDVHIGIGSTLWAPHSLVVGSDVYIGKRCTIEVDGRIGAGTLIANDVGIVGRRDHDMRAVGVAIRRAPWVGESDGPQSGVIDIGPDVWVGYGAVLLAPVTVGRGAVIGAGAVVTRDVAPYSVVAGNPAEHRRWRFTPDEQRSHEICIGVLDD